MTFKIIIRVISTIFLFNYGVVFHAQVIYLSPLPNSEYNNPNTNIIIKFSGKINKEENLKKLFRIYDSAGKTYSHTYRIIENGEGLLLRPDNPFTPFEKIYVELIDTLIINNCLLSDLDFQFKLSDQFRNKSISGDEEFMKTHRLADEIPANFPYINTPNNYNPSPGKIFLYNVSSLASNNDRFLSIINNNGVPEFWRQENNKGLGFTLQPSGFLSYWNEGNFVLMDSSYSIVDTIGCKNGYIADFHEFIHSKNGHSFLLSWDMQIVDLSGFGGDPEAQVEGLVIQELDEKEDVVFQWRSWDHFKITDAVDIDLTTNVVSYVHGNGLDIASDINILLSLRLLNEITKINKSTGEIIWRLGGKNNQFEFINDAEQFCRQHHIQQLENGNYTLYDNGSCHLPQISAAKEYQLDTINKKAELIWYYKHPNKMYCSTMGNAQRLPNGNTFINWGLIGNPNLPNITEVEPDGTIVFELNFNGVFQTIIQKL